MNGDTATQPQSAVPQVNVLPQPQAPNTSGMTQVSPDLTPRQPQGIRWSARGLPAIAMAIVGQVQKRKQRETEAVVSQFVGNYKGIEESKGQLQQVQQENMKLAQAFQAAQTPEEKQQLQQRLMQNVQQVRQLQASMETNRQNLHDMFNGPKQDRHTKIISKAFGIDDKNAASPERQAAIKVIQDQMKLDQKTASMVSRLPQRQQLSPEARAQSQMQQAGVLGKPVTGGQQLHAYEQELDRRLKAEAMAHKVDLDTEKMIEKNRKDLGLIPVSNEDGSAKRDPKGQVVYRNLEESEMSPEELQKYKNIRAQEDLRTAQAKAVIIKANAAKLNAESLAKHRKEMSAPGYLQYWANVLSDPSQSSKTIGTPPKEARGAILSLMAQQGKKLAYPLGGKEISTMDLANSAVENIERARAVLERRPDLFGPAGFFGSKFEMAMKGGDPDAADFYTAINLANLPAVGIHGVRGKWALQDLHTLDGNLYRNPESMANVLDDIYKSASEFRETANRPPAIRGTGVGGGGAAFSVPAGAPPAPKEDGHYLKQNGKRIAKSQGGQWVAP